MRLDSIIVDTHNRRVFKVDISKYEFCSVKNPVELDAIVIYVYTPTMIVYEKLRAICQQMDAYQEKVGSAKTARARDFFDIYTTINRSPTSVDIYSSENLYMLKEIFSIKSVPIEFLGNIKDVREFHRDNFASVLATVSPRTQIQIYDFYFDYVVEIAESLLKYLVVEAKTL